MLVDVCKLARQHFDVVTQRELAALADAALTATNKAAAIAREISPEAADAILEEGMHP